MYYRLAVPLNDNHIPASTMQIQWYEYTNVPQIYQATIMDESSCARSKK